MWPKYCAVQSRPLRGSESLLYENKAHTGWLHSRQQGQDSAGVWANGFPWETESGASPEDPQADLSEKQQPLWAGTPGLQGGGTQQQPNACMLLESSTTFAHGKTAASGLTMTESAANDPGAGQRDPSTQKATPQGLSVQGLPGLQNKILFQ